MKTVVSRDGTRIAYETLGSGSPLILVDGAFGSRAFGPLSLLSQRLAPFFTVYTYDRRGRNDSGDTPPYTIHREIEDISALIQAAGSPVGVYGISSGAILALEAAAEGVAIRKLAVFEPPYVAEGGRYLPGDAARRVSEMITSGRREEAVEFFLLQMMGVPREVVRRMRREPTWKALESVAHTLPYDIRLVGDGTVPARRLIRIGIPTLVLSGSDSAPDLQKAAREVANVLPRAEHRILPGQTHDASPEVIAPLLVEFFGRETQRVADTVSLEIPGSGSV